MKPQKEKKRLDYEQQKKLLTEFLKLFEDKSIKASPQYINQYGFKKYMIEMQRVANFETRIIEIQIEDLESFFTKDIEAEMVKGFRFNTERYIKLFEQVIAPLMPQRNKQLNYEEEIEQRYTSHLMKQRIHNYNTTFQPLRIQNQKIPFRMHQNFDVSIIYGSNSKTFLKTINQIKAENIGELVITKAIVVRSSQVRPQLIVGTYACEICSYENYSEILDQSYKPMIQCNSPKCKEAKMNGKLTFLPNHSKFRSFQQMKIQQTPEQLKRGAVPKSTHIELRGSLVNTAQPGDIVKIQGIVLPKQYNKNRFGRDLYFDSYIYVTKIVREKKKYVDLEITEEMRQKVQQVKQQMDEDQLIEKLARSIAPEIYGMESVKKALLYQMAGGVTAITQDDLRIRGQINVALFGDPGIAKSQLLKHISYISPRAVYTTGKGSSGVGLTAAIVSDPVTKQLFLQAGALVLADMGICCIDQFDKMQEHDRTAIHQVMEQQTVSITKAGIITTLNSRTAVLAAANPLYGRYNKAQSTQRNLNLPAALLSRFDLIFVMIDTPNKQKDLSLAKHIGQVHQKKMAPFKDSEIFDEHFLKTYIAMCKEYQPLIHQDLNKEMISKYVKKRQLQLDAAYEGQSYTTMRSLLAMVRLSQARAKLRFSNQVSYTDVLQSLLLIEQSQKSVQIEPKSKDKYKKDTISLIYELIKTLCSYNKYKRVQIQDLKARAAARGFLETDVNTTIENYCNLGVLAVTDIFIRYIK